MQNSCYCRKTRLEVRLVNNFDSEIPVNGVKWLKSQFIKVFQVNRWVYISTFGVVNL